MMRWFPILLCWPCLVFGQHSNGLPDLPVSPYGLRYVNDPALYSVQVLKDPQNTFLDMRELLPKAKFDVTYATENNFLKRRLYPTADVFMRRPAAEALLRVARRLKSRGLGLVLYDGYRPYAVTVTFFEEIGDTTFVAHPRKGSKHNRGMAIDLSMFDLRTGKVVPMPSGYDEASERAWHNYNGGDPVALENRAILRDAMVAEGFEIFAYEWWHYDYKGWQSCITYDVWHQDIRKANRALKIRR